MPYTKKNPSTSNQYSDTVLFQAFDNGIGDAHQYMMANARAHGFLPTNTAAQNKSALQTAMNTLAGTVDQGTGAMIYIPAGDYSCEGGLSQPGNIILTGDGPINTRINHTTNDTLFTSLVTGQAANSNRGWQHLKISGNSGAIARGVLVGNCYAPWIMNVQMVGYSGSNGTCLELHNGGTGVGTFNYTEGVQIYNLICLGSKYNLKLTKESNGTTSFSNLKVFGSYFDLTGVANAVGLYLGPGCHTYGSTLDFKNHSGPMSGTIGIHLDGGSLFADRARIKQTHFNVMHEAALPNPGTLVKINGASSELTGYGLLTDDTDYQYDTAELANRPVINIESGTRFRIRGQEEEFIQGEVRANSLTRLFEREIVSNGPASNTYYKLATLPVSSTDTRDKLKIDCVFGGYTSTSLINDWLMFSNREGFAYAYKRQGVDSASARTNFRIQCFSSGGAVTVWARASSGAFVEALLSGMAMGIVGKDMSKLGIGTATTTVPTGTLVFDSGDAVTYPPNG